MYRKKTLRERIEAKIHSLIRRVYKVSKGVVEDQEEEISFLEHFCTDEYDTNYFANYKDFIQHRYYHEGDGYAGKWSSL